MRVSAPMSVCPNGAEPVVYHLVPGTAVGFVDGALVARRAERTLRVGPGAGTATARIASELGHRGSFEPSHEHERVVMRQLTAHGITSPLPRCLTVFDVEELVTPPVSERLHHARIAADALCPESPWVGVGRAGDPEIVGELVQEARARGRVCWVLMLGSDEVLLCREHPNERGCPRCATLFDRALLERIGPGMLLHAAPTPAVRALGSALLQAVLGPGAPMWLSGSALIASATTITVRRERIPAHPQCVCGARAPTTQGLATGAHADWDQLAAPRLSPVWPLVRGNHETPTRVAYPRSRAPAQMNTSAVGMALAIGEQAELRALGEAIERFAMLHAQPDAIAVTAERLGSRAMPWRSLRQLVPADAQYALAGFRHQPFQRDRVMDWVRFQRTGATINRLVPSSLVGGLTSVAARIADPNSNGWAAHTSGERARANALLELLERDALLRFWHFRSEARRLLDRAFQRDDRMLLLLSARVPCAVVLALGLAEDGGLRTGAAASLDLGEAMSKAGSELALALTAEPRGRAARAEDITAAAGPEDHRAYWSGSAGRALFESIVERIRVTESDTGPLSLAEANALLPRPPGPALPLLISRLRRKGLTVWFAERRFPELFGAWIAVRALVPGLLELSFGGAYARLGPHQAQAVERRPHPFA